MDVKANQATKGIFKRIFGFYALPMYILTHPFEGFYEMKYLNRGSLKLAIINFLLVAASFAFASQYASIVVNMQNPLTLHSLYDFFILVIALILFCASNWSVTSLTDGEGRFKDILMAVCYAMTPLVLTIVPAAILSNFLSVEEAGFYFMILSVGTAYFVFLVFAGLVTVHNYTGAKAIATVFLTFIALLVIVFLITLLFTLWQQLVVFAYSVYTELMFRA